MDKVYIGKVVNTHGIKGEFRIKSDFERKDLVFVVGKSIIIEGDSYEILSYRVHKGYDMVNVKGISDINDAISFKGKSVFFERVDLGLEDDEYVLADLIGAEVKIDSQVIGVVVDYTVGVNPLLEVKGEKIFYIPIKGNFIKEFKRDSKELIVDDATKELIL